MTELPAPNIVYEQRGVIVFNKPPGLLTQAPPGIDSLELRARQFLMNRDRVESTKSKIYLTPVHRLDRPVSGLIVFARNVRAAKRISAQFQQRSVTKKYLAWVEGEVDGDGEELEDFMRKIPDEAKSEIVPENHVDAKKAALRFSVRDRNANATLVEIELLTGRTHQIRLQFASRGHAVLGDALYGSETAFGAQTVDLRQRQIALHAWWIEFDHPIDDEKVKLKVEPDWGSVSG
jgi:23S rRNA pseudouridine1911/1915/1917 synthase